MATCTKEGRSVSQCQEPGIKRQVVPLSVGSHVVTKRDTDLQMRSQQLTGKAERLVGLRRSISPPQTPSATERTKSPARKARGTGGFSCSQPVAN